MVLVKWDLWENISQPLRNNIEHGYRPGCDERHLRDSGLPGLVHDQNDTGCNNQCLKDNNQQPGNRFLLKQWKCQACCRNALPVHTPAYFVDIWFLPWHSWLYWCDRSHRHSTASYNSKPGRRGNQTAQKQHKQKVCRSMAYIPYVWMFESYID